jgi:diguanylate cyclase (GGDEF)-like protein
VKSSEHEISKYRNNTILWTVAFISIVHIGLYYTSSTLPSILLATWIISNIGAILIIHISFLQQEKFRIKLQEQLIKSRKHSQRQTTLASLSAGFATALSEDEICNELARRLIEIQGYDYVAIYLIDEKTKSRELRASAGGLGITKISTISSGKGLSEQPLLDGKLQYTPDVSTNSKYIPGLGRGSEIDVPIQFDQEILGVITVENPEIDAFGPDDYAMVTTASDQAALAIQNTRLLASEKQRRSEAEILRDATIGVSSDLDLDIVLDKILTQLAEVVPFDSTCIFLWKGDYLEAKAARGLPKPEEVVGNTYPANDELFKKVLLKKEVVIIGDIQEIPYFQGWGGTDEMHSWMGIPLIVGNNVIGILTLDNKEVNAYDQEKVDIASILANQAAIALQNAQLYLNAKNAAEKLIILHEASQKITRSSFDPERTYVTIHEAASRLMPCEAFSITILDEEKDEIEAVYLVDRNGRAPLTRIPSGEGLSGYIISTGEPLLQHDYLESETMKDINVKHFGNPEHIRAFIAVPMKLGNKVIGMLSSQSYLPHKYTNQDQQMLEMLAAHAAIAIDNAKLFARVQHLAITDSLTDVFNRRYFFDSAKREFYRARRYQHHLSIIMIDLDYYKIINDTYGHIVGDSALKIISKLLQDSIRGADILGRYGGDEFSILLPETDIAQAMEIAERLRRIIEETLIEVEGYSFTTTVSIGVATTNVSTTDFSQLLLSADMALYDAKKGNRNQVCSREWPFEKTATLSK